MMASSTSHWTKRKVSEVVEKFPLVMDGLVTYADLNVLPLGSYDMLIGMEWLEVHRARIGCYKNTFECMDEEGNPRVVRGIPKMIYVRHISAMRWRSSTGKVVDNMKPMFWKKQKMKLLGWRNFIHCRNSGMFFLMKFQGFFQTGTLISQLNLG